MHDEKNFVCCAFVLVAFASAIAQCGGTERWQVKVGADSGVTRVQLTPVTPILIDDLIQLLEPDRPEADDNDTRLDEEVHVYEIRGKLMKFKLEAGANGDRDYHLVISDDTGIYTDNHAHVPPGHSVVAEIPDPDCIPGQHGDPAVPSRFINQIKATRAAIEAQFPNINQQGKWNDAGGITARIVGVGFFDFPHGQVGRATNNIELHPVLDIEFSPAGPAPSLGAPATPLLVDGGFEEHSPAWVAGAGIVSNDPAEAARQGSWKAWLGGYGSSHTDTLYQLVMIPSSATTATLTFFLHVGTQENNSSGSEYDTLKVQIRDATGIWLKTPLAFSNLNAAPGFTMQTVDLSGFRGRTIRITFVGKEDGRRVTSFIVDDVQLRTQ